MLEVGQPFPSFSLSDQDGNIVSNHDLLGSKAVIFFYPKDDTPGCTIEACEFRDAADSYGGARVLGVSPDSPKSHLKFIKKFKLTYTLLSDVDKSLCEACGLWVEKSFMGKKYMGVDRTTYLLDASGNIEHIWTKVKPLGHSKEVRDQLAK
ncbi:MAG: thioredoxin-dependent thiol peroxidase [Fimbriimonadaceae bacterium]